MKEKSGECRMNTDISNNKSNNNNQNNTTTTEENQEIQMKSFYNEAVFRIFIYGTFTRNEYYEMTFDPATMNYSYVDYVTPGRHKYKIVYLKGGKAENQRVLLETELKVKPRDKELKPHNAPYKINLKTGDMEEKFVRERSVFCDFRDDNISIYNRCFEREAKNIKMYSILLDREAEVRKTGNRGG